jgi:D-alanyl-D-alanine carboxypeptidase
MRTSVLLGILSVIVVPSLTSAQEAAPSGAPPDRRTIIARIDSLVTDHLSAELVPSAAVAVVRGSDTLIMRGYGLADREAGRAANAGTVYEIGSITKQYTAAAIMRLVEAGKVDLDADISEYLAFPLQGHRVTVRQLLNHTSGIHSYTSKREWRAHWADDLTTDSIVGFVARDTFDFAPGTSWRYNNTGYVLLGMIIEKASGKSYAAYVEEELFRPLGLTQTRYCPPRVTGRDTTYALGYGLRASDREVIPAEFLSMTHPHAAGALCSTVRDYAVWQRALHGGQVVSPESYRAMTTPDTLPNGLRHNYGFGLLVGQLGPHRIITHGGGIHGFSTAQMYVPAESLTVVVFTNSDAAGPGRLESNIARAVLGLPLSSRPVTPPVVQLDSAERDKLVGVYDLKLPSGDSLTIRVFVEGGRLIGQAEGPGQGPIALLHYGDNVFGASFDPSLRLTFIIEAERVTGLRLQQRGGTMEGPRRD